MKIKVLTIFPDMLKPMLGESILGRACAAGLLQVELIDIRAYSAEKHKNTDDYPFGGGAGMVMLAQPICDAMRAATREPARRRRIYLSPRGRTLTQRVVEELSREEELVLLCGHYEGVDQRSIDLCVDEEISIGDYVLTGGELGAMVLIDAVARLVPGVLGSEQSSVDESFSGDLLEYPQYTRPRVFEGIAVPEVLLNGDHARIARWRREQSLLITRARRPDILERAALSGEDWAFLAGQDAAPRRPIESARLSLRPVEAGDWRAMYDYLSNAQVMRFVSGGPLDKAACREEAARRAGDTHFWAVCLRANGRLIGQMALNGAVEGESRLECVLSHRFRGRGYATEAARALIACAFENGAARRITAQLDANNAPFARLLERLGFVREGCLRKNARAGEAGSGQAAWRDTLLYALLKEDFYRAV